MNYDYITELHYCMQRHKSKSAQLNRFLKGINMK